MRPLPKNWKYDIFDIPFIEKQNIDISDLNTKKWLINIKNLNPKTKNLDKKIVHSFNYDKTLIRYYDRPYDFLEKISGSYAACSFDFSLHKEMTRGQIIEQVRHNRWIGAFMQSHGIKVIACVGWVDKDTYDICFAGLRDGAVFIISTLGANNNESRKLFLDGFNYMKEKFPNSKIICVGDRIDGMSDDVCFVSYEESFGNDDNYVNYCQMKLFDWDLRGI